MYDELSSLPSPVVHVVVGMKILLGSLSSLGVNFDSGNENISLEPISSLPLLNTSGFNLYKKCYVVYF